MSQEAFLPCFACGATLRNAFPTSDNQPSEGTEFRTMGHYGSTFWDWTEGEELVLNICDDCLSKHKKRLGQQKAWRPVACDNFVVGRYHIDRPLVSYSGILDDAEGPLRVELDEVGTDMPHVEWASENDLAEIRAYMEEKEENP